MKKLAVVLAAIMVAALALPVSAATLDVGGKLSSEVYHDLTTKQTGTDTDLELTLGVGLVGEQNVKGVLKMSGMKWVFSVPEAEQVGAQFVRPTERGTVTAYLEAQGPYWTGGPSVITRIGDLELAYSPFILDTNAIDGISVSGMAFGSVGVDGFYGWANNATVRGARAMTEFAGVGIDGAVVAVGDQETDYMAHAIARPMPGLAIEGLYAVQTSEEATAMRAAAAYRIPFLPLDVTASAGYRRTGSAFNPIYGAKDEDNPDLPAWKDELGVAAITAGLDTSIAGFDIAVDGEILGRGDNGKLDDERSIGAAVGTKVGWIDVAAGHKITQTKLTEEPETENTTTLGVGFTERPILPNLVMSASYNATITDFSLAEMRHVAKAAVGADVGAFRGISVSGMIDTKPGEGDPGRQLGVEYGAPCGVKLGYSYEDYVDEAKDANRIYAGLEVSF